MRVIRSLVLVLLIATPRFASAQSFVLQGSAGPTLIDSGYSLAGGIGFSPTSRLTVLFDLERTHLSSRLTSDGRGGFAASGAGDAVRRFAGATGWWDSPPARPRPNVNDMFPIR